MEGSNDRKYHHSAFKGSGNYAFERFGVCLLPGAIPIIVPETAQVEGVDEVGLLFDRVPNFWGTVPQLEISGQEKILEKGDGALS